MALLQPKEIEVTTQSGETRTYIISKIPAIPCREIVAKYPISAMPKLGDYKVNEETMLKLMSYVGVPREGSDPLLLTTQALVNNHVPDWETLARIEMGMLEYNVSFFGNGKGSTFLEAISRKAQEFLTRTLTDLQAQSSRTAKPPSEN